MGPQSAGLIITLGFGAGSESTGDTHDGDAYRRHTEATRLRDEEYRRKREDLRSQLLAAVERVTGKPPPLDQSLKQLAAIARKSEGFDYQQVLRDIQAIESIRADEALSTARDIEVRRLEDERAAVRAQIENENAQKVLLLMAILG